MKNILSALKMLLWLTLVTGLVYPLFITFIAQTTMKQKADGNIIYEKGKAVGAELIAQKFEDKRYFWPRPSAINYTPMPSGGSNLAPTSKLLKDTVEGRKKVLAESMSNPTDTIPSELLFASASGIDPHISPEAAYFQIDRIIKARNIDPKKVDLKKLINDMTTTRHFGFLGRPCINVLLLNRALDQLTYMH